MTSPYHPLVVSSALLGVASTAFSQESGETILLDPIRIESVAAQDVLGNTSISSDEIEARNAGSISDVLRGESEVTAGGGAPIAQKVFVHGIEETLLSVTIDGARQNKAAFHHTGNVLIDPSLLKQIDISSGIAPADAGPGALAGVIAYETKGALDLLEPGDDFGVNVTLSYDTNSETARGVTTLFGAQEGFEYLLSGTRSVGSDYEDGAGDTVRGTESDVTAALAKFAFTAAGRHRFEFSAEHVEDSGDRAMQAGPGGLYYARPDFNGVVGRDSVYREAGSERNSYRITYTDEAPEGIWAPKLQLNYNEQIVDAGGADGINTSLSGTFTNYIDLENTQITAGIDFFQDEAKGTGELNVGSPKETLENIGVFAQVRQDIGERLSFSYGGRYDAQTFELADGSDFKDDGFSLNAMVDIKLTDAISFNIGGAQTWGGYELSEAALINLNSEWDYGDPEASTSTNFRTGLRFEQGAFTASAAYFKTEIEDVNDVLSASREAIDLTSEGYDVSLRYDMDRGYAQLNYTHADVERDDAPVTTTDYYVGRPVGDIFGLSGMYQLSGQIVIGGVASIVLENDDTEDEATGYEALPAYEVVDIYAIWTPERFQNIEMRFDVRNLFDETYALRSSDGINYPDRIVALNEPGRSFGLTVSAKF